MNEEWAQHGRAKDHETIESLSRWVTRLTRELDAARGRIKELEKYAPPAMFEGTEIVWDDVTEARELVHELLRVTGIKPSVQMLGRYPWLKRTGQG